MYVRWPNAGYQHHWGNGGLDDAQHVCGVDGNRVHSGQLVQEREVDCRASSRLTLRDNQDDRVFDGWISSRLARF